MKVYTLEEIKELVVKDRVGTKDNDFNCPEGIQRQADRGGFGIKPCIIFFYTTMYTKPIKDTDTYSEMAFSIIKQKFEKDGTPV